MPLRADDPFDERPHTCHPSFGISNRQIEVSCKPSEWFDPIRRHRQWRRPNVRAPAPKDRLAGFAQYPVIGDQFLHEQEVNEVAKAFIAPACSWRQGHAVQFLCDVEAQRQARKVDRPGDAERVRERNGRQPFDLRLARFGARDINGDGGPCTAEVTDGEFKRSVNP